MSGADLNDESMREMAMLRQSVERAVLPETLGDFVRQAAVRHGDTVVGVWFDEGETLSYRQLDESADRLAFSLVQRGVRKGTHVAVMLGNRAAYLITWVALARIGAVIVPVNTAYKINDLSFILEDSDAQFFVVAAEFLAVYEQIEDGQGYVAPERVFVHGPGRADYAQWADLLREGRVPFEPPSAVYRTDLLNIQYTSGTTGFPKGCLLSHDYWLLLVQFAAAPLELAGQIRKVLVWQPFFYMDGMWLFLTAMRLGGCAYVASKMRLGSFHDWLRQFDIEYCIFPEAALKAREQTPQERQLALRYVSIYGWSEASRRQFCERYGAIAREGYGMSEIGLAMVVPNKAQDRALEKTCGLAGPHRQMRIVDEHGRDVADGTAGELWVAGRSILWAYYKRPRENAASFRQGWFRTGDLFYRNADGYYFLVGRLKDMIKRSGENIAAREVEATLCELDQIAEAAVVGVPDPERREEVKAYILLREGFSPAQCPPQAIIEHCARKLALFKVPRYIAYVQEFPRTPSRKIRKQELLGMEAGCPLATYDGKSQSWTPGSAQQGHEASS
ncbi:class I adenylate-forming enzyme family protein [Alcaligenes sp. SDU_A2]|uniref:class I adenylate-forming enzyme family protein n=1 Tax=Alcaligenes sp. SDU_A2 TaxID=3136634 RepID=UPI00311FCDF7